MQQTSRLPPAFAGPEVYVALQHAKFTLSANYFAEL